MRNLLLVTALASAPAFAHTPKPTISIAGTYSSNWGEVTLQQQGTHVIGTYVYDHGSLDGTLDGNMLRFSWHESAGTGRGVFVVATNGELVGTWGSGQDDLSGGGWRLTPATAIANP